MDFRLQVDSGSWTFTTEGDDTDPDQVADWTLRLRVWGLWKIMSRAHESELQEFVPVGCTRAHDQGNPTISGNFLSGGN